MSGKQTKTKKRSMIFIILYYWGKLIGLNPLSLTKNNVLEFSYFSFFYNCFLVVVYTYICYRSLLERFYSTLPFETPIAVIVHFIVCVVSFIEITFIWLMLSFRQNRVVSIVKSFAKLQENFQKIGVFENDDKHITRLAIYLFASNGVLLFAIIFNDFIYAELLKYHHLLSIFSNLGRLTSVGMLAIFAWCMNFVRQKFRRLNENVRSLMENDDELSSRNVEVEVREGLIDTEFIRNYRGKQILFSDRISLVAKLHRELRDVIRLIEGYCQLFVLLDLIIQVTVLPLDTYITYLFIKEQNLVSNKNIIYLANSSYWIVLPFITMSVLVNACGSTAFEANKTGIILHEMLNNRQDFGNCRESAKIIVLSLDLLQNRVRITLFGLVELDYSLLYRTLAAATTNLVIMLQFDA